jgi:ABC-type methionine transport system permease subunit
MTVILLIILVQVLQMIGMKIASKTDKRTIWF